LLVARDFLHSETVSVVVTQISTDFEKLEALRRLDPFRLWRSLDDERRCLSCGRIINGREIRFVGGTPESGELRALCPTENCEAVPLDWSIPEP
jgi:hypothetical protein